MMIASEVQCGMSTDEASGAEGMLMPCALGLLLRSDRCQACIRLLSFAKGRVFKSVLQKLTAFFWRALEN